MTTIKLNGISFSAGAAVNGLPLRVRLPERDSGDFAETRTARDRRKQRRHHAKRRCWWEA